MNFSPGLANARRSRNKPWFDQECHHKKREARRAARKCQKGAFKEPLVLDLNNSIKEYKKIIRSKKNAYKSDIVNRLSNIKNTQEFWKTINSLKRKKLNSKGAQILANGRDFIYNC